MCVHVRFSHNFCAQKVFVARKIIVMFRIFRFKKKIQNVGCARKNMGMREIRQNAGF